MASVRAQTAMDPRWQKIEEGVCHAVELPIGERRAWLDQFCAGDSELRAEIQSLLSAEDEAQDFLEHSAAPYAGTLLEADSARPLPPKIGQYKILREIGRGGMGVVYLGEREDEFKQQVAIKLVKRGLDTEEILQRFRNERQILASLNHPNIAKLFDGGMTEDGLPYFVMEYIEGEPLTKYSDLNDFSISNRLQLFRRACAAVQHAHQNLIIHRDLKPSNILVTSDREAKLLDFGVAKLLTADSDGEATMTRLNQRVMTPQYASPEQIRGKRVTTATDVYSLGVVLYELLTGVKPYNVNDASPQELTRAICETEPTKPSLAISASGSLNPDFQDGPTNLHSTIRNPKFLRGDLDNIVLMALRKDPERRYRSVEQFSADIDRHLRGLPVMARRDTFQYRSSKFVTRNKLAVSAAAIVLAAIVAGAIVSIWQARVAAKERNEAQQEQAKAEQLNKFLQSILMAASPEEKGKDAKVIEVLDDAAQRLQTEFANQPALKGQALSTVGQAYIRLGLEDQAEKALREAVSINAGFYGEENQATATSESYLAAALINRRKLAEAEPLITKAVATERKLSPAGSKELAFGLQILSELQLQKGDFVKATAAAQESVTMFTRIAGEQNEDSAFALMSLGRAQSGAGDLNGAEVTLRRSIAAFSTLPPRYESRMVVALMNLGLILVQKGNYDEGVKTFLDADRINQKLGAWFLFNSKLGLCSAYANHADYNKAVEACAQAVEAGRKAKFEDTPEFILVLDYLGLGLTRTERAKEAEPSLRESFDRAKKDLPSGDIRTLLIEGSLGECLTAQGRFAEAEPLVVHSYEIIKADQGDKSPLAITAAKRLFTLYAKMKKPTEAAKYKPTQ